MKDPREGSPFFPGEMAIRHPHLLYADLISPTISFNPPVQPIPQEGRFSMDITNQIVKGAKVKVVNRGKKSKLTVEKLEEPPSGELDKSYGKIVRINMFRKRAGFKVVGAFSQPEYIISVETGGKHYYAKSEVEVDGYALLKHFPDKKSEPRLRVETRGYLELYGEERTVVIRGKEHPLYDKIIVHHEGRDWITNPTPTPLADPPSTVQEVWAKEAKAPSKPFDIKKEAAEFARVDPWICKGWSVCVDASYGFHDFLQSRYDPMPVELKDWKIVWGGYYEPKANYQGIDKDPFHVYIQHKDGRIIDFTADQFQTGHSVPFYPNKNQRKWYTKSSIHGDLFSGRDWITNPTPLADLLPPQLIISISGPSGMGKSSVQKELKKLFGKKASLAPTYTTRGKRVNEKQGIDIKTVTDAKFEKMRESGEFTAPNGTDLVFENYGGKKYARRVSDLTATPIVIIDQSFKALERMREAEIAPVFSVYLRLDRPREEWEKIIRSRKEPEKIVQQRIKSGTLMEKNFRNHNIDVVIRNKYGKLKQTASKIHSEILTSQAKTNPPQAHVVIDGSPKKDKKLRAVFTFPDGRKKTTHFGGKHYSDYTIHKDKDRKKRYDTRHSKREDWEDFTTAGALSKWILWNKPSLKGSFDHYLALFSLTGELKVKTSLPGYIPAHRNPPMDCPPATQDLELNTKNRNSAIKTDYIRYGPLNLSDEKYYEDAAEHWNTDVATAKKSKCSNCVAFDISPRMLDCMPGPVSQDIEDEDGYLGYCWMHHFKCHSARTCFTWAAGGPIDEDDVSYEWQERSGIKTNPPSVTPEGRKIPKRYLKGLNKEEMIIAAKEIDKGYKYDIDDPKAYEFWKSDIKAQARGYEPVPSKYKKKFIEMYGPLPKKGDFLSKVSKATGVKKSILEEVMDRGLAAWRGGHAAATVQHQWATGRVYSFVTLGNTVMKDGRRMSDYKLAEEAGIIPDELKIPKKNPLQQTMSGKAIQMEKPATGRKVFYIPEEEDWYIVTVGYTSQKAAKDDMKEFEKIAKNHIEGDFKIVNKKKYNYAVKKGTKIPSGLNPRTGGPKLQQQAIQTRKSDEGETIFGGDPLLGESWKSNPPHQVQLNADGSTKAIANQIRREMQASGISVIQNAAMTPNSTYIELLPSEGQFDITVVAPSSSNKSLLLMDQVALFLSDDTGLDIATLNSNGKTALGNRLSFQSSSENGAIGILVNEELSTHDYYIKIAEAVTKAFRAKENPPEGTTVMTFNIRIPIKFEDTLDAFIKLEGRGYSWKNENFKNMWFTMHTPYGEKTSIHMQQSQTYLYNAHKMSEKEQEKVIEDLKAAGGVMKRKARSVSRDHLSQTAKDALNEVKKKLGRRVTIPPEIFNKLKEGDKEPFDEWLATQKPVPKEQQQQQQKPQQQQQKPQQQQQTRTSGPKQKVKQVESNLSKNLIKSLSGRKHPQTEKEKKASKQNQKKKKKKNPPTDGERCVCGCLIYISEWDGNMETGPPPIPGGYCRGFCKDIYTHEHREKYREHFGSGGGKKEYARSRFEQGDEVPFSWEDGYKPPQKSRGIKMQMEDGHVFKKYKTNPGLDNDAIYYLEDFGKAMTDAEAKRKFKSEKLRGPIGSEELFMQLAEKVQDFGEASGWIKDGRLYFRKGKKTVNEAMVTGYILEGATAFFHTHPRAWEPSQTSPDDFKVYHGLFTVRGIQDHFTVMGDRIDWFHFNKSDRIDSEEVARNIIDIESDIEEIFMKTEGDFLDKTDGNAPLRDRTKAINDALNKQIPEYKAKFKNYQMSPVQISKSKVR